LHSLAKTLPFSVKNQKLCQLLGVSLIAIYKSLRRDVLLLATLHYVTSL
jgi:hypothetical protein